ncbi:MAG: hypothetical protein ACRDQA_10645 [Nocardioidaceae bacterium]
MTVVIAGCGDVGTEAGLRFAAAGLRVLGLRRSPQRLPAQIEGQAVDLSRQKPRVPADTEIVVFGLAADRRTGDAYRSAYVDALGNTLDALADGGARPQSVLFVSSTAVYGVDDGSWVDEVTPAVPASRTGIVLREAEDALHQRLPHAIVLRLGGIYGPGRTKLVDQVRAGTAVVPEMPRHTNRIHRDDAAAAIVHLTTMRADSEPVYLGVDQRPAERGEIIRFLADEMRGPRPPIGTTLPTRGGNKRCCNHRLSATGFEFTFPSYREGYRAVLAGDGIRHP